MIIEGTQLHEVTIFGIVKEKPKRNIIGLSVFVKPEINVASYIYIGGLNGA